MKSILIVDDNEAQLNATAGLFVFKGYEVKVAGDAPKALEVLRENGEFSLALIDINLRGAGAGLRLIQEVRELCPSLRIIVYTAGDQEVGSKALQAGAMFYIQKTHPEDLAKIADAVGEMWELERKLETHKLKSEEMQRIFDAVGVELLVRDAEGKIILVNETKKKAWAKRHPGVLWNCLGKLSCLDCRNRTCPSRYPKKEFDLTSEWQTGKHTLILQTRTLISDVGDVIGTIEAAIDFSRRQTILNFEHQIETLFNDASKQKIAEKIAGQIHQFTNGRVRVYLPSGNYLEGYCGANMEPDIEFVGHRLLHNDAQAEEAFQQLYPIVRDLKNDGSDLCEPKLKTYPATQKLFIPLINDGIGGRLGMIVIDNKPCPERRFTKEDIDLLALFRPCIETALVNAERRDAVDREKKWLHSIAAIDQDLLVTQDFELIEGAVMGTVHELLEAQSTSLLIGLSAEKLRETVNLCDEKQTVHSSAKKLKNGGKEFAAAPGGPIDLVFREKEILIVKDNLWEDEHFSKLLTIPGIVVPQNVKDFRSAIVAPLDIGGKIWAVAVFWFTPPLSLSSLKQTYLKMMLQRISMVKARTDDFHRIERVATERANESSVGFLATAYNHNFRHFIQGLLNRVRLLEGEVDVLQRKAVSDILHDIHAVSRRIENLRSWVKPDGREAVEMDLVGTLREVGELVASLAEENQIKIGLELPEEAVMVASGGGVLKIAILDLFQNGIKFMTEGGRLDASLTLKGKAARLKIQDTGRGLPAEVLKAINEPETMTAGRPDTPAFGLGLYLALKAIARVKGTIRARNREGGGAEFEIEMPTIDQKEHP